MDSFNTVDKKYFLGECESVHSVTVGQRARIGGLPKPYFVVGKSIEGEEDGKTSKVYVCEGGDHPALLTNWCVIKDVHFIHDDAGDDRNEEEGTTWDILNSLQQVRVKTRYASPLVPATMGIPPSPAWQQPSLFCRSAYEKATTTTTTTSKTSSFSFSPPRLLQINFAHPEKAVSIGQAVVLYHHSTSRVLGVGSIAYHGLTVFEEQEQERMRK
jgi:tRNA U34 2-thiouridine synthase MnmA/TrmU